MVKAVGVTCMINFEVAVSPRKVQMRNKVFSLFGLKNKLRLHSINEEEVCCQVTFYYYLFGTLH